MLALWVEVRVRRSQRQRFLGIIEADALGSEAREPGCLRFNVLQDARRRDVFYFYEVYQDRAALRAHRGMEHFKDWARARQELLAGAPRITECQTLFPAQPAYWRKGRSASRPRSDSGRGAGRRG